MGKKIIVVGEGGKLGFVPNILSAIVAPEPRYIVAPVTTDLDFVRIIE